MIKTFKKTISAIAAISSSSSSIGIACFGAFLAAFGLCLQTVEAETPAEDMDWQAFLAPMDMLWSSLPFDQNFRHAWAQGAYTGNGHIGAMIHLSEDGQSMEIKINRGDVQDHRDPSMGGGLLYNRNRLPVGSFHIQTEGRPIGVDLRLDLWNAELRGHIQTERGRIEILHYTHALEPVIVTEIVRGEGETQAVFTWRPAEAISPRQAIGRAHSSPLYAREDYLPNPSPTVTQANGTDLCIQPLAADYGTVTAWREISEGVRTRLLASIAHQSPVANARAAALQAIERAATTPAETLRSTHRAWWNSYYPRSFVSLPDRYWESFYWIQMYKFASTTRADGMLVDTCGIWLEPLTPWPAAWWNLNVQLTYWPLYGANRLDLAESLLRTLFDNPGNLSANAGGNPEFATIARNTDQHAVSFHPGRELSNLPWALHNVWLHYRHTMDQTLLREQLLPLLGRAMNFTLSRLEQGEDGTLHFPKDISPEYDAAHDTNYNIALTRWMLQTLLTEHERLGTDDPRLPLWQQTLDRLVDYQINETGFMIGRERELDSMHRHYSHLLMIYPLYLVNWDQEAQRELIRKSVDHWAGFGDKPDGAYRDTGAASMYATMRLGDLALERLNRIRPRIEFNTMYREAGPVIETPFSATQTIHDMLLQSWGDRIRIMPAVPSAWADVTFHDLRTEGAFEVGAVRRAGVLQQVEIKSLAGEPCRIEAALARPIRIVADRAVTMTDFDGIITLDLSASERVLLLGADTPAPLSSREPVVATEGTQNPFGGKR